MIALFFIFLLLTLHINTLGPPPLSVSLVIGLMTLWAIKPTKLKNTTQRRTTKLSRQPKSVSEIFKASNLTQKDLAASLLIWAEQQPNLAQKIPQDIIRLGAERAQWTKMILKSSVQQVETLKNPNDSTTKAIHILQMAQSVHVNLGSKPKHNDLKNLIDALRHHKTH